MHDTVAALLQRTWHEHDHRLHGNDVVAPHVNWAEEAELFRLLPKMPHAEPELEGTSAQAAVFHRHQQAYDEYKQVFYTHFPDFFANHSDKFMKWVGEDDLKGRQLVTSGKRLLSNADFWVTNHCWLSVCRGATFIEHGGPLHAGWEAFHTKCPNMIVVGGGFNARLSAGQTADLQRCGEELLTFVLIDSFGGFVAECVKMSEELESSGRMCAGIVLNGCAAISCGGLLLQQLPFAKMVGANSITLIHQVAVQVNGGTMNLNTAEQIARDLGATNDRLEKIYVTGSYEAKWMNAWGLGLGLEAGKAAWVHFAVRCMSKWEKVIAVCARREPPVVGESAIIAYLTPELTNAVTKNDLWGCVMRIHDNFKDLRLDGIQYAELNGWQVRFIRARPRARMVGT